MNKSFLAIYGKHKTQNRIILIILFLYSFGFLGLDKYLGLLLFFSIFIIVLKNNYLIRITNELVILTMCFFTYIIIYSYHFQISLENIYNLFIMPILSYVIGIMIVCTKDKGINIRQYVIVMYLGLFVHGILNMTKFNSNEINVRIINDFWSGTERTATLQGVYFTMAVSLLFYCLFILRIKRNYILKPILLISIILSILSTLNTASRTLFLILAISFIANIILYGYLNKNNIKNILKILLIICISVIVGLTIYFTNFLGIKDSLEKSPLYKRQEIIEETGYKEPRFNMYKEVISQLNKSPLGGKKIEISLKYAHNLWLDVALMVGVIPFVLIIIYSFITLKTLLAYINSKKVEMNDKYVIFSVYIGLTMNFMVEPILEGIPQIFMIMVIMNALTKSHLILLTSKKN